MATLSNSSSAGKGNRASRTRAVKVVLMGESLTRVYRGAPSQT
jgi:hypothetical protein